MPDLLGSLTYTWPFYAAGLVAFLIGAVPFGLLLTRLAGLGDIRAVGSGNIGATNVLRTGRKGLAALTLLLDGGKGTVAVLAGGYYGPDFEVITGVAVVAGHMFPPWLRFRGGKGVATSLGALFALSWPVALVTCATWLLVAFTTRFSSLAALIAVALAPAWLAAMLALQNTGALPYWLPGLDQFVPVLIVLAVLVIAKHHANIGRLLRGEEPRIGRSRSQDDSET